MKSKDNNIGQLLILLYQFKISTPKPPVLTPALSKNREGGRWALRRSLCKSEYRICFFYFSKVELK